MFDVSKMKKIDRDNERMKNIYRPPKLDMDALAYAMKKITSVDLHDHEISR